MGKQLGLNEAQYNSGIDSNKYVDRVKAEVEEGKRLGIKGTPTIMVEGNPVQGAGGGIPTAQEIIQAVDAAIAAKGPTR